MVNPAFALEQATPEEARKHFFEYSNSEQWNPSRNGYEFDLAVIKADPSAFWLGKLEEDDQDEPGKKKKSIVYTVATAHYGDKQGWLGLHILDKAHRGRGLGLQGFTEALKKFSPGAAVGLDGVMAQVKNYEKSGFVHHAWTNERRHGRIEDIFAKLDVNEAKHASRIVDTVKISGDRLKQLWQVETEACGLDRPEFAEQWVRFHNGDEHRFGVAYLSEDHQTVLGYACVRPAVSSYRVGPLYAESEEIAAALLASIGRKVLAAHEKKPLDGVQLAIDIDVPDKNKAAMALFDRLGWPNTFPCARLWSGAGAPKANVDHCFAVCSLEFG
ncbi:hypothetical protein DFQ27_007690 [Actinomortierella ambigua]|uniref:YitH/HolE acetyltransferase (GNAT) domain-containing protein n=1 Tax=Actinomortierella ambigua TaxID=1343610 RepID=A0A9P6TZT9_9FUNG|nr:hypothetical protein DFQ27_007690 [Actinomortierella ambigua]